MHYIIKTHAIPENLTETLRQYWSQNKSAILIDK